MKAFRLIGNSTRFALQRTYLAANCIPAVIGVTLDGKRRTVAREADIIWLDDFRYKPMIAPDELGRYNVYDCEAEDIVMRTDTCASAEKCALLLNIKYKLQEQQEGIL